MSDMEQIVRPFQSPNTINDKKTITILPKVGKSSDNVLEWGSPGAPPIISGLNFSVIKKDRNLTEVDRKTRDVRIENPDDPNQYIMEKQIIQLDFSVKEVLPIGGGGGSSAGQLDQGAYKPGDDTAERLKLYQSLISQGIPPAVASSMAYGSTGTGGPSQEEIRPGKDFFKLKPASSSL